ncbi:MAG: CinA family protein [Oscillospiraceae bacterium]|nr:CinA family protein [Oscillospiraceae bacterium]
MKEINYEKIKELIAKLKKSNQTIAIMESCTGGGLANSITDIPGASEVFEFGAVTYSNKTKIALGGEKMNSAINTYSVYSKEVAEIMASEIAKFANATYGVGVTGQLGVVDLSNITGESEINKIYFSIYDSTKEVHLTVCMSLKKLERYENKSIIINEIIERLMD